MTKPRIDDFDFVTIDEELKVDGLCQNLLQQFYEHLQEAGLTPEQASDLAYCADYYVRDFVIDFKRQNLLKPEPGLVLQFAGNWYITRTLEPELGTLTKHLEAISGFYSFPNELGLISGTQLEAVVADAAKTDFYSGRINSFLEIKGDGFVSWEQACPLREVE